MRNDRRITFVAPRAGVSGTSPATRRHVAGAFPVRLACLLLWRWPVRRFASCRNPRRRLSPVAPALRRRARRPRSSSSPPPTAPPPPRSSGARDIGIGGLRPRIFYRLARAVQMAGWRVPRRRRWLTAPAFCVCSLRRIRARHFYSPLARRFAPFQK